MEDKIECISFEYDSCYVMFRGRDGRYPYSVFVADSIDNLKDLKLLGYCMFRSEFFSFIKQWNAINAVFPCVDDPDDLKMDVGNFLFVKSSFNRIRS